jgi:hypothetical protein
MTSTPKKSTFISKAMIRENIRRLWPMTLVATLVMLVSGPLVVIFASGITEQSSEAKQMLLLAMTRNFNLGFVGFEIVFPIITAIALFKYLHSPGGVAVVHALPLSRDTQFRSNVLSGLILIFAPIIITVLTLLPFMRFGFKGLSHIFTDKTISSVALALFSDDNRMPDIGDLIGLFIIISVIVIFVFAVSILSVVITGTSGVGFISAGLLNFIVPVLFLLTIANLGHFLYGYTASAATGDLASSFHPLSYTIAHSGGISILTLVIFVAISVAVLACAMLLYRAFRSERAGDTIVFKTFEYALTWLVTFLGMIAGGFFFESITFDTAGILTRFSPAPVNFYIGAVIGAVLTFVVVTMVVNKSPKAFGVKALKSFGCFAVIGILFFVFVSTDLTGFETRVPENSSVKKASITITNLITLPYLGNLDTYDPNGNFVNEGLVTAKDPASIAAITDFHREIIEKASDSKYRDLFYADVLDGIDNSVEYDGQHPYVDVIMSDFPISYDLGGKHEISRAYTLTTKYLESSESFKTLFETKSFKDALSLSHRMSYDTIASVRLSYPNWGSTLSDGTDPYDKLIGRTEAAELAKCLDEDFAKLSYQDLRPENNIALTFTLLAYDMNNLESDSYGREIQYSISDKYDITITWLRQHGYYDDMVAATAKYKADYENNM